MSNNKLNLKAGMTVKLRNGMEVVLSSCPGSARYPLEFYIEGRARCVTKEGNYCISGARYPFDVVEIIKDENGNPWKKEFTKDDLKPGMFVTMRDGSFFVVFNRHWLISGKHPSMPIYSFSSALENPSSPALDIMKVEFDGKVVWEREEKTEKQKKIEEILGNIQTLQEQVKQLKGEI